MKDRGLLAYNRNNFISAIYAEVERSGNKGITAKDIALKYGVNKTTVNSILYNELKGNVVVNKKTHLWFIAGGHPMASRNDVQVVTVPDPAQALALQQQSALIAQQNAFIEDMRKQAEITHEVLMNTAETKKLNDRLGLNIKQRESIEKTLDKIASNPNLQAEISADRDHNGEGRERIVIKTSNPFWRANAAPIMVVLAIIVGLMLMVLIIRK